ncbi:endonuclease/exonuclease/phosphatase family protein [Phaeacidiphilus oryzae]|uniref:endonuclease/exonuclease/phosphatase family protein n=1 Tax=Phaeacidiphilus oryzae TaxID=348818 RepID=UPI00068C6D07|nr:endonuclease/exonuclease/phosphatase family protein [Phaeacidiphilus oryzae]
MNDTPLTERTAGTPQDTTTAGTTRGSTAAGTGAGAGARAARERERERGRGRGREGDGGPWRRGRVLTAGALLLALLLLLHGWIPNRGTGNLGSLVETFLPWFGLLVPVLLLLALLRRSATAAVALVVPAVVWLSLFGGVLADKSHQGGDFTVAEENVDAGNPDPAGTARALAGSGADLLALVELTPQATGGYERALAKAYPYRAVEGTVGVWSKRPLSGTRTIDVTDYGPLAARKTAAEKLPSNRALRTTVTTAHGPLTVYVAHLGSVRVNPLAGFSTASRDIGVEALDGALAADRSGRTVLLGDLNGTFGDRALAGLAAAGLRSAQDTAGDGFGFTWPARFPVARIDQVLVRGVRAESSAVLGANGSDHLPVTARLGW